MTLDVLFPYHLNLYYHQNIAAVTTDIYSPATITTLVDYTTISWGKFYRKFVPISGTDFSNNKVIVFSSCITYQGRSTNLSGIDFTYSIVNQSFI